MSCPIKLHRNWECQLFQWKFSTFKRSPQVTRYPLEFHLKGRMKIPIVQYMSNNRPATSRTENFLAPKDASSRLQTSLSLKVASCRIRDSGPTKSTRLSTRAVSSAWRWWSSWSFPPRESKHTRNNKSVSYRSSAKNCCVRSTARCCSTRPCWATWASWPSKSKCQTNSSSVTSSINTLISESINLSETTIEHTYKWYWEKKEWDRQASM